MIIFSGADRFYEKSNIWSEPETFVQDTYNPVRLITIYAIETFNLRINKKAISFQILIV